mmetsp:Transcript_106376/g.307838  ORF Transcript_106376/g.307838 Transcript_106376/m.307838 type:complete len:411 (+) Transcript_106376:2153-3385(+)
MRHAALEHRLLDQQQQEVRVDIPLVNLVDDEAPDAVQGRLAVQPSQHDGCRRVDQARALRKLVDESDLIANLVAQLLATVFGNVLGQRDRGDTPGLRANDHLVVRHQVLRIADELRDECRLPATCVAADDGHCVVPDAADDPVLLGVRRQALHRLAELRRDRSPGLCGFGLLARNELGRVRPHFAVPRVPELHGLLTEERVPDFHRRRRRPGWCNAGLRRCRGCCRGVAAGRSAFALSARGRSGCSGGADGWGALGLAFGSHPHRRRRRLGRRLRRRRGRRGTVAILIGYGECFLQLLENPQEAVHAQRLRRLVAPEVVEAQPRQCHLVLDVVRRTLDQHLQLLHDLLDIVRELIRVRHLAGADAAPHLIGNLVDVSGGALQCLGLWRRHASRRPPSCAGASARPQAGGP